MAFTPNTAVYLLGTPLDSTNKNQLRFDSLAEQHSYFNSQIKHRFEGVTYQRKNNVARVDAHIDDLWNVNYCMYQNTNFGSKWFYAFVTKMEYVSDRATDVYLETDVFQTWKFDFSIKPSFVVREHVANDAIGTHLVDERLDTGEYTTEGNNPLGHMGAEYYVLGVSDNTPLGSEELVGNIYAHVPTGLSYWLFEGNETGTEWLKDTIALYTSAGKADAIVMLFTVPEFLVSDIVNDPGFDFTTPIPSQSFYGFDSISVNKSLANVDGYVPRNNKLFTYPYKFLYVTNNTGSTASYRYEDFDDPAYMSFALTGAIMPDPKLMLAPSDYKGGGLNYDSGLTLSGFPLGSWASDTYNAWLASNGASTAINVVGSAALLAGGIATGGMGLLAAGAGGVNIAGQLAQWYQASIQPDQSKGQVGNGSLLYGTGMLDFYLSHMTIKKEFAKRIDDFFTMYGYKVNALKVPETQSRLHWNYVQTIDINIEGDIPSEDMVKLKTIFNSGVTLWHDANGFLNYSQSNPIR